MVHRNGALDNSATKSSLQQEWAKVHARLARDLVADALGLGLVAGGLLVVAVALLAVKLVLVGIAGLLVLILGAVVLLLGGVLGLILLGGHDVDGGVGNERGGCGNWLVGYSSWGRKKLDMTATE